MEQGGNRGFSAFLTWRCWLLFGVIGVAAILRLALLDARPMHNDEAVNGVKFETLWEKGAYRYDPHEYHGPSLFYTTLAFTRLSNFRRDVAITETKLRLVVALFGIGLMLLLPLVKDGLGRNAILCAALFTAISPAMVYYSRYYIHEMLLVFFAFLAIGAGWRYWRTRNIGWMVLAGVALGLLHATKETFVFNVAAAGLALGFNHVWNRFLDASGMPIRAARLNWLHLAAGFVAWLIVTLVFFSSFFTNWNGPLDSVRTYFPWLARAGGESPHIHPWYFYYERLLFFHPAKGPIWSEAFIFVLGVIGGLAGFARKGAADANSSFVRFVALYTFFLSAIYCLIPYKTPWCLLSFWHGTILLAAVGAMVIYRAARFQFAKTAAAILLCAGSLQLAAQAWVAAVTHGADQRNPYVYAHTSPDLMNLVAKVSEVTAAKSLGAPLIIKIMAPDSDYWPLPWYLRRFPNVGCWDNVPAEPFGSLMIVSSKFQAALDDKKTHVMVGYFQLRPGAFFELYVELDLWRAYLAKKQAITAEPHSAQ